MAPDAALQAAAKAALQLLDQDAALVQGLAGPQPTQEMYAILSEHHDGWPESTPWPGVEARCRRHDRVLAVWTLDPIRCAVIPKRRPTAKTSVGYDTLSAWIDRANVGKGRVHHLAGEVDGHGYHGTHILRCGDKQDGHDVTVTAKRRLRLYLQAVNAGRNTIQT